MEVDGGKLMGGWVDAGKHEGINKRVDSGQKLASPDHLRSALNASSGPAS